MNAPSPESLQQQALQLIEECRARLNETMPDFTPVDQCVRVYCEAIASLPKEEGRKHVKDLEVLMDAVNLLKTELVAARETTQSNLEELGRHKQARSAYQKSDAIGGKKPKSDS